MTTYLLILQNLVHTLFADLWHTYAICQYKLVYSPSKMKSARTYVLSAASFSKEQSESATGPSIPASFFGRALSQKRPSFAMGGFRFAYEEYGLYQSAPRAPFGAAER